MRVKAVVILLSVCAGCNAQSVERALEPSELEENTRHLKEREQIDSLCDQVAEMPEIGAADVSMLASYVHQLAEVSESLAAEAADRFADALIQVSDEETEGSIELLYKIAARYFLAGSELPLSGVTADGGHFDSDELADKVVIVYTFATWCAPCAKEREEIYGLYEKYQDQGLEVVAISADESVLQLEAYLEKHNLPWVTLFDRDAPGQHPLIADYGITEFPTTFVIGRDGLVLTTLASGSLTATVESAL